MYIDRLIDMYFIVLDDFPLILISYLFVSIRAKNQILTVMSCFSI